MNQKTKLSAETSTNKVNKQLKLSNFTINIARFARKFLKCDFLDSFQTLWRTTILNYQAEIHQRKCIILSGKKGREAESKWKKG